MSIEIVHSDYTYRLQQLLREMTAAINDELVKQRILDIQMSFDISIEMRREGGYVNKLVLTNSAIKLEITR